MNRTQTLTAILADAIPSLRASAWEKHGRCRVYLRAQKNAKAYLEVDETETATDPYAGIALKVFVDGGNPKWAVSQAKQIKHSIMVRLHEAARAGRIESDLLRRPIADDWRDVIV